ncbi:MAG: aminotransferase class III-fold pyridoxal phosphate-dependent enzyme, partial [Microbacterium sp.]|nr:aminotransferase class III-fold pyridoxal phosphate-dependent enzyme [Microbacterium sp.]
LDDDVAAVFVEPILGEAGVIDLPEGYLAEARALTARHGALLVLDEVQTGVGRTGDWYAFHRDGITPDIVTTAKGLAGGVPIGATVAFGAAASLFTPGRHGTTFGGNPLATTAALAVLGEIERAGLVANARAMGERFRAGIEALGSPLVTDLSGRGLLIGVGLAAPVADEVVAKALTAGLIINAAGASRLRVAPPLIVGADHIDEAVAVLGDVFAAVHEARAVRT